ncbi:TetR/AcrR family transcriptional regulator [Novosphingobium sp.]|uniref:TetR/AcrR family transcriptional regulator n=1 Tax=Novosphingobium sp. TaxID=1874826 RepID=UPI0025D06949|nr:TetR/AcrR family transcriptional regulator [Novosphingobium sp.]MCC6925289.1 TetR/AcrR family transcriptional regulator [Novosphingobium sp.]
MSIRNEQRERVIALLSQHLLTTGLAQTSLRQLARAAGVSDRMLLYYFTDKAEVLAATMSAIAGQLVSGLAAALPEGTRLPPRDLALRAASLTTGPEMRRFMRLWVEMVAAAAKNEEPYKAIVAQIMAGFRSWVDARLDLPEGTDRAAVASALIALIDGLALVDICSETDMAPRMAGALEAILT